ncbi:MAG: universal stress protein [Burkholderiales bacterium]|nr:universal stress protein [Burkholderiales bacterium]
MPSESAAAPGYRAVLAALDGSDRSDRALAEALALATAFGARLAAAHIYAARLHDLRFRQMEGGLPEPYREDERLGEQRAVHNELIERGLRLISDSYLDAAASACAARGIAFTPLSLEGKNYRALLDEANSGRHDLVVLGANGLGASADGELGTVCERVARRAAIDCLIVKEPQRALAEGALLVALDGSAQSWGALRCALALARHLRAPLHAVSAYDPHFHYTAFRRLNSVLSDEARALFRFEAQQRLHEEIIDGGLARIYEGHLAVAESMAREHGVPIQTRLLEGKPCVAIARHVRELRPALLMVGRLGVHADAGLDIGGNAERLLRAVDCAVLLGARAHRPPAELLAEATIGWTAQAEQRLARVPEFARPMARLAILRFAQERDHTIVTGDLVLEAVNALCPHLRHAAPASARPAGESDR